MPAPTSLSIPASNSCGSVVVEALSAKYTVPPAGNLAYGFAEALEHSGLFEPVYYQRIPDETVDYVLRSKFDARYRPALTRAVITALLIVGTLGALAPVIRFSYRYDLAGDIEIFKGERKINHITAATQAKVSTTLTSISQVSGSLSNVFHQAKRSLYRQLIMQLTQYCDGA